MRDVTISLPDDLARWVREKAAEDDRSVSQWIADCLARLRQQEEQYDAVMRRSLSRRPSDVGWREGRKPTREELYDPAIFSLTSVWRILMASALAIPSRHRN